MPTASGGSTWRRCAAPIRLRPRWRKAAGLALGERRRRQAARAWRSRRATRCWCSTTASTWLDARGARGRPRMLLEGAPRLRVAGHLAGSPSRCAANSVYRLEGLAVPPSTDVARAGALLRRDPVARATRAGGRSSLSAHRRDARQRAIELCQPSRRQSRWRSRWLPRGCPMLGRPKCCCAPGRSPAPAAQQRGRATRRSATRSLGATLDWSHALLTPDERSCCVAVGVRRQLPSRRGAWRWRLREAWTKGRARCAVRPGRQVAAARRSGRAAALSPAARRRAVRRRTPAGFGATLRSTSLPPGHGRAGGRSRGSADDHGRSALAAALLPTTTTTSRSAFEQACEDQPASEHRRGNRQVPARHDLRSDHQNRRRRACSRAAPAAARRGAGAGTLCELFGLIHRGGCDRRKFRAMRVGARDGRDLARGSGDP